MAMQARTRDVTRVAQAVGLNVRRLRIAASLNQSALASKVSACGYPMTLKVLSVIERGTHNGGQLRSVSVDELVGLARALNVAPEALLVSEGGT